MLPSAMPANAASPVGESATERHPTAPSARRTASRVARVLAAAAREASGSCARVSVGVGVVVVVVAETPHADVRHARGRRARASRGDLRAVARHREREHLERVGAVLVAPL